MRKVNNNVSEYRVIGLMSGTSLDGLDVAFCTFSNTGSQWSFSIQIAETIPYVKEWEHQLRHARDLSPSDLHKLSVRYGEYLARCVNGFVQKHAINNVDLIASHGHTVHHRPDMGITVQIGDGQVLSNETGMCVVHDFRIQDVQKGGQGAPLVPIGDKLLFGGFDACMNLGGFANISFDYRDERIAFDICPVNSVMNDVARGMGMPYDDAGRMARSGRVDVDLLEQLNSLEYYSLPIPKSLGVEWVEQCVTPLIYSVSNSKDVLATLVAHISEQISKVIKMYKLPAVLVTGGGAFNTFLMEEIERKSGVKMTLPNREIIEYKEALIFGFMGILRHQNQINVLKSVTGANQDHSSGKIAFPGA